MTSPPPAASIGEQPGQPSYPGAGRAERRPAASRWRLDVLVGWRSVTVDGVQLYGGAEPGGERGADDPDRDEHQERPGRPAGRAEPAGHGRGERSHGAGQGCDRVVDAVDPRPGRAGCAGRGAGVLGGQHRLLQCGGGPVVHHVGRQESRECDQQQEPVGSADGHDGTGGRKPEIERDVGPAPPDLVGVGTDQQRRARGAGDERTEQDPGLHGRVGAGREQRTDQHGREAVAGGPQRLRSDQPTRVSRQVRSHGRIVAGRRDGLSRPQRCCRPPRRSLGWRCRGGPTAGAGGRAPHC